MTRGGVETASGRTTEVVEVQLLRGFAALLVVVYHAAGMLRGTHGIDTWPYHNVGAAGVDLFFVISGFIMVHTFDRRPRSPVSFLLHRLARIAPLYWLSTLALLLVVFVKPGVLQSTAFDLRHFVMSLMFLPAEHPVSGAVRPFFALGWTLNYEMFFYTCLAVSIAVSGSINILAIAGVFAACVAVPFFLGAPPHPLSFYCEPIILEFVAGMLIGRYSGVIASTLAAMRVIALAVAVAVAAAGVGLGVSEGPERVIFWGVPATILVALAATTSGAYRPAWWSLPRAIGDASYSIYLTHYFVLGGLRAAYAAGIAAFAANPTVFVMLALCGSTLVGYAAYMFVERPLWTGMRRQIEASGARG